MAVISLVVIGVLAYLLIPGIHSFVNSCVTMLSTGDFTQLEEFMSSYGVYAAIISFILMILQAVIAPLPAFLITVTNANLFGWWQGAILSWSSAMVAAAICFWIARLLGRDVVEKLTNKTGMQVVDTFFLRHGRLSVLIARLLPFVSFDFVSYFAGLTSMSFGSFLIATGIGQLPATIVYSYVGGMLTGGAQYLVTGLLIMFALFGVAVLARRVYVERTKRADSKKDVDTDG